MYFNAFVLALLYMYLLYNQTIYVSNDWIGGSMGGMDFCDLNIDSRTI